MKIQMPIPQGLLQQTKIMSEQVEPDAFEPPCHKLKPNTEAKLEALVKEYKSQFAWDETSISKTHLTKMSLNTGNSKPVPQKSYQIAMTIINGYKMK